MTRAKASTIQRSPAVVKMESITVKYLDRRKLFKKMEQAFNCDIQDKGNSLKLKNNGGQPKNNGSQQIPE